MIPSAVIVFYFLTSLLDQAPQALAIDRVVVSRDTHIIVYLLDFILVHYEVVGFIDLWFEVKILS